MVNRSRHSLSVAILLGLASLPNPVAARDHGARHRASSSPTVGQQVIDLTLRNGEHQRILVSAPTRPRGAIVMLPGGAGDLGLEGGDIEHGDNFVVRTRALWNDRGYVVLIPDTVDHVNLRGLRSSLA